MTNRVKKEEVESDDTIAKEVQVDQLNDSEACKQALEDLNELSEEELRAAAGGITLRTGLKVGVPLAVLGGTTAALTVAFGGGSAGGGGGSSSGGGVGSGSVPHGGVGSSGHAGGAGD